MKFSVFVDAQEGTTGLRIHEYLAQRADIKVLRIEADRRKDAGERARLTATTARPAAWGHRTSARSCEWPRSCSCPR